MAVPPSLALALTIVFALITGSYCAISVAISDPRPVRPCVVCQTETRKRCEGCKESNYCCRDHLDLHLRECSATSEEKDKALSEAVDEAAKAPSSPAAWAVGMKGADMYEWFVDMYRMRVDDDAVWAGGYLHGLYTDDHSGFSIVQDFAVFCRLAVRNDVIPAGFNWSEATRVASKLLPFAFEKRHRRRRAGVSEKYGGENIFASMLGGRSLRGTGEMVYGTSCMGHDDASPAAAEEEQAVYGGLAFSALTGQAPPFLPRPQGSGVLRRR